MTSLRHEPKEFGRRAICRERTLFVVNGAARFVAKTLFSSPRKRDFLLLMAIGAFMAAIGAFDTDGAAIERRLIYWLTLMMAGWIIHGLLQPKVAGMKLINGYWRKSAFLVLLMTLALTPVVWLVSALIFGAKLSPTRFLELSPGILVVNAAVVAILGVSQNRLLPSGVPTSRQFTMPDVIRDKLPVTLRDAPLIALQAEDHYIRVYTSVSNALVRMKFRDAIDALDSSTGFQTHRSWWVSEAAIREIRWRRGRAMLRLENNIDAPVSRKFAKNLAETKRL